MALMNHAFPMGSRSRGVVRLLFRLMHPGDWPMLVWHWVLGWMHWIAAKLEACLEFMRRCAASVWGRISSIVWRRSRSE